MLIKSRRAVDSQIPDIDLIQSIVEDFTIIWDIHSLLNGIRVIRVAREEALPLIRLEVGILRNRYLALANSVILIRL
jgi:hypothetical protein